MAPLKHRGKGVKTRLISASLIWLFLASACSGEPSFPYEVSLNTVPNQPVPSRPVDLYFQVTSPNDTSVEGVMVTAKAFLGSIELDLGVARIESDVGAFSLSDVELVTGVWGIDVTVWSEASSSGSETTTFPLVVKCSGSGAASDVCCADTNCQEGLICVAGVCAAGLAQPNGECWSASDCESQVCSIDDICSEARCDDEVKNGTEVAVDCGGDNCGGCPKGTPCTAPADCASELCEEGVCVDGVPLLGNGRHDLALVEMIVIGTSVDSLSAPRDVAVNPADPQQLWVVNNLTDSATIFHNVGTEQQWSTWHHGMNSAHFLAAPSALAFGDLDCYQGEGCMATAQETDEETQGAQALGGSPPDFMGPTLWPTNPSLFDGSFLSHLDMLHNSPNGAGIAWEKDNVYWVFDGYHESLTRYDYVEDHDMGGTYHADGIVHRYVENQVSYLPEVHAGMLVDLPKNRLLSVDPGNNRVVALELGSGVLGADIYPNYDFNEEDFSEMSEQKMVNGATLTTLIDCSKAGLLVPSGLARHEDVLYISDYSTGYIWAFDAETGDALDWLDTGIGTNTLSGMDFDPTGRLYFADKIGNRVFRLAPAP